MRTTHLRSLVALLAAVLLLSIATPAIAGNVDKPRPYHGFYADPGVPIEPTITCDEGIPFAGGGTGHANHLGAFTWDADYCLVPTGATSVVVNVGYVTIVAANGDLLYGTWTGEGKFLPDGSMVNTQEVTYEGGTGRFERAVGNASVDGVIAPDGSSINTFEGTLAFDASDRGKG